MFHRHSLYIIIYLKWYKLSLICIILTFFKKSSENIISLKKLWFYKFVYFPLLSFYTLFIFSIVSISWISLFNFFKIYLCILPFFNINFHLFGSLGFYRYGLINICLFIYLQNFSFWIHFWCFSQFIFHTSIICFHSKK